jgi:hypothetical protein
MQSWIEDEKLGGQSTTCCGSIAAGRQDADCNRKKCKHGRLLFFLPYSQQLRLLAAPSPLSLLIVGLLPVPELMDFE